MAKKSRTKKKSKKELRASKNIFKNIFLGLFFCSIAIGTYVISDRAESFFRNYFDLLFKSAGFRLDNVRIIGTKNPELEEDIKKKIGIIAGENIFKLSSEDIYQNLIKITNIKDLAVRKILPNSLIIEITEKTPIAIFQKNSKFFLIDKEGSTITEVNSRINNFPIVIGEEANTNAEEILKVISKFQVVMDKLESMMFIRKRRWDIVVDGIHVKLPQDNLEKALETLATLLKQPNINKHTANSIDLRMQEQVSVKGLKIKSKTI